MGNFAKLTLLSTALITIPFAFNAKAEEANNKAVSKLSKVTVVATRTEQDIMDVPAQVSVVDADEAIHGTTSKVSDLLRRVPGLEFSGGPRRNGEEIKMRGYDSEGIIIMVDGKKQNFNSAHDGRFFLDPSLIKKVEVVRGPSSASYGPGGLGGVIAFETVDAEDVLAPGETEAIETFIGGESATQEFVTGINGFKRGENFDAVANVTFRDSEDIDLGNGTKVQSDDDVVSGFAKFTYFLDDNNSIKFDYTNYTSNSIEPNNPQAGPDTTTSVNLVNKDTLVNQIGLKHNYNPESKLINLDTHLYYVSTDVEEGYIQGNALNSAGDVIDREVETIGFNLDNKSIIDSEGQTNHTLSYGFEAFFDDQQGGDSSRATRNGVPNADAQYYGVYLQDEIKISDILGNGESELYIVPAVRFDSYRNSSEDPSIQDQDDEAFSPKIAANLKVNKNLNLFTSWAQAFRAPTLTEQYAAGVHFPVGFGYSNNFVPNPNLSSETNETFEVGAGLEFDSIAQSNDNIRIKGSWYTTDAEDYIEQTITAPNFGNPFTCPFPFVAGTCSGGTTTYNNVASASLDGFEVEIDYTSDLFNARFTGSRVNGTNDATGQWLESIAPFTFTGDINFPIEELDLLAGYFVKAAAPYDNVATPTAQSGRINQRNDYVVHNLYYRYEPSELPNLTLDFGVDNLLDKTYTETFASNFEVGRNFKARLTYKW